jgi:hypothetical protein
LASSAHPTARPPARPQSPFLSAAAQQLEKVLGAMHLENYGDSDGAAAAGAAGTGAASSCAYMSELGHALESFQTQHLGRLPQSPQLEACKRQLVARLVVTFVRHASLVRPLTEAGKLKLVGEMSQLELVLGPISEVSKLGPAYAQLRSLRPLLFVETGQVLQAESAAALRPSVVWHHLLSRGPHELQSPHAALDITAAAYVEWISASAGAAAEAGVAGAGAKRLAERAKRAIQRPAATDAKFDVRAEGAVWAKVRRCLDAYAQRMAAKGVAISGFHPVYKTLADSGVLLALYEERLAAAAAQ